MSEFISVAEYAKKNGKTRQYIYRLIKNGRFKEIDLQKEEVCIDRITINEDAIIIEKHV